MPARLHLSSSPRYTTVRRTGTRRRTVTRNYLDRLETENTIYTVNKAGSNAVYVVLAVAFILTASAKASSAQPAYALRTFIAVQLSLNFEDSVSNCQTVSHSGTVLILHNISFETSRARQSGKLQCVSGKVFDNNQSFFPASVAISFGNDAPFTERFSPPSIQDARYRLDYLKRDPVYVRFRS